ncbi:MAG TPA: acyl-ACP thioesterase domain-containing protein [Bacteroidales bacterium]|nr:acyl-ACP thioesterase domain-containing protein [Bacteroidales bacterium]
MLPKFEKPYRVHVYETGPDGKLNVFSLFNYMQDIASDHAEVLGYGRNDLAKHNSFWVLSRLYTEILQWPEWEDDIIIRTWPNGTDKLFALRNYEICRPDGEILVNAASSWLILDSETRKIQRPDGLFAGHNIPQTEEFSVRNSVKLESFAEQGHPDLCFRIKTSDLDINLHTNNAVYLKWVSDAYDPGFCMKNNLQSVEINYLAESKYDEEIMIRTSSEAGGCFNHSILRNDDKKELCRVRMIWKPQIQELS